MIRHLAIVVAAVIVGIPTTGLTAQLSEIAITSSADGKQQKAFWWHPINANDRAVPLLVVLHTWSGNYQQKGWKESCLAECEQRGWAIIHPDFRGPNRHPDACGSDKAVQDILDAVAWARKQIRVDNRRVYLVGTSGGGHMSLLMAGRAPHIWAGVSAWVPISDLAAWHRECTEAKRTNYARDCEKSCGGAPGVSKAIDAEFRKRSPLTHLHQAEGLPIDINAGIHDGYTGSVPVTHSLRAFNTLAEANHQAGRKLADAELQYFRQKRKVPDGLETERVEDSLRKRNVLFRRNAGPARVTIFDGGHEGDMPPALKWLGEQKRPIEK